MKPPEEVNAGEENYSLFSQDSIAAMRSSISGIFQFMSFSPQASASSSHTLPPRASDSSAVIYPHTCGFLISWFHTLTAKFSNYGWSGFISRFLRPTFASTPRSNTAVGVHDLPQRLYGVDFISSSLTIYGLLIGLLLTLIGIKYQGSNTNPFSEHPTLMLLFLMATFAYFSLGLLTLMRSNNMSDRSSNKVMPGVCHVCGVLACELLLLVLVSSTKSLLINVSSLALIVMWVLCRKFLLDVEGSEEQDSQMVDLEAPTVSTA